MSSAGPGPSGAGAAPRSSSAETITVALADDHRVVRAGLRLLLDGQPAMRVVAEAGELASCERVVAGYRPRVLVLDVGMADGSGIAAIGRMRSETPDTRIVVLTAHAEPERVREALRAGASGFVPKQAAEDELIAAVHAAADGRIYLNPELGARIAATDPRAPAAPDDLTARELEVLALIAHGHTNAEIAAQLFLSVRTVESHRAHIQQKTGRATRAQLVAYAREHGLG